jgi:hypothetical protein
VLHTYFACRREDEAESDEASCGEQQFVAFPSLASALNMSQGFSIVAEGAIGRVPLTPLVEECPTRKLEASRLHESFLIFLGE